MMAVLFNPLFPIVGTIIVLFIILLLLIWFEIKRKQKLLAVRLLTVLIAVISLAGLILRPSLSQPKASTNILLTPGYNERILDSLSHTTSDVQLYTVHEKISGAEKIKSYRDLSTLKGNIFVLGEGIPQYMLEYVDSSSLTFFPSPAPAGFSDVHMQKVYAVDQRGEINGVFKSDYSLTLKLIGPGIQEDSLLIKKGEQSFTLQFTPKTAGKNIYAVNATDSIGRIVFQEKLPIQVVENKPLSILFLNDFPSAEVKFLKNLLERKKHKLTLRYKISKDRYRTEFVGVQKKNIDRLNAELLQTFDLVITDVTSLASLSSLEINQLKEALKSGLGIVTIIDKSILSTQASKILDVKLSAVKKDSAQLIVGKQRINVSAIPVAVSSARKIFATQQDATERFVSGYYNIGLGKSGFQLLSNTFNLQLSGEKDAYAEIWSNLFESVSRKEAKAFDLTFKTSFPYYPDEPLEFEIIASEGKPSISIDSINIDVIENPMVKNIWYGKIWASKLGWNTLRIAQDSSEYNFWVSEPDAWKSLQVITQQKALKKIESQHGKLVERYIDKPISEWIFYISFLLSAGFLWLVPKL